MHFIFLLSFFSLVFIYDRRCVEPSLGGRPGRLTRAISWAIAYDTPCLFRPYGLQVSFNCSLNGLKVSFHCSRSALQVSFNCTLALMSVQASLCTILIIYFLREYPATNHSHRSSMGSHVVAALHNLRER